MTVRARRTAVLIAACLLAATATLAGPTIDAAQRDISTLELTTTGRKSGQPRTVTIWFVVGDHLYVQSGRDGKTDWYQNIRKTPAVTVKIGEQQWKGQARPVADAAESERVHQLFKEKYLTSRIMSWFGGGFGVGKVVAIELE